MDKYKMENSISSLYPNSFFYYGIMGTDILWRTDYCQKCMVTYGNRTHTHARARAHAHSYAMVEV